MSAELCSLPGLQGREQSHLFHRELVPGLLLLGSLAVVSALFHTGFLWLVYFLWASLMRVPVNGFRVHLNLDLITTEKSLLPSQITFPGPRGEDTDVNFGRKATDLLTIDSRYFFFPHHTVLFPSFCY